MWFLQSMASMGLVFLVVLCSAPASRALDNGLAQTPPMGWNSWNKYTCAGLNEKVVRETADAMASNGMQAAGYDYVLLDDCWQSSRDTDGNIVADAATFPSGIKALADYVHSKGLKFGLYTDAGTKTCAGRPGSLGHEYQDALQYARWGVDYLKEDWCNTLPNQNSESSYTLMRDALAASGRPILFSICEWSSTKPWLWAAPVGNMWRATGDILNCWDCKKSWGGEGVSAIIDQMADLWPYAGPGQWNDPDMLQVGNGGLTFDEERTHFSMWAMFSAPLIAGNDVISMSAATKGILLNREVIAVDQDKLGQPAHRVSREGEREVWSKQLLDGSRAVALVNRGTSATEIRVHWTEIGYPDSLKLKVHDLWAGTGHAAVGSSYSAQVPAHGTVLLTMTP